MSYYDMIIWFLLILGADIMAMVGWEYYKKKRNKRLDATKCDDCQRVRRTKISPDRKHWLCKECMKIYTLENINGNQG